jgi:hypothetical protein
MKIGSGIQTLLSLFLHGLRGCGFYVTNGRDLWSSPLRWRVVASYNKFRDDRFGHSSSIKVIASTD